MVTNAGEKSRELDVLNASVVEARSTGQTTAVLRTEPTAFFIAQAGELLIPWGQRPKARDRQLREFWSTEPWLATTVGMLSARNAALDWTVTGDEQTTIAAHDMINNANFGGGWEQFVSQTTVDLLTQDSGAFVELIRDGDTEEAPVIGFAHLDAARCWATGVPEFPVLYETIDGKHRLMPWYSVVQILELPDPRTFTATGYFYKLQHCGVSRLFRSAQILKNVGIYTEEKTGGRFTRGVHLISGFQQAEITGAIEAVQNNADAAGLMRYSRIPIVSAINPEQKIDHKLLEMAGLPDNFDEEKTIKNYITLLANSFGVDYQDIAPLPGGNLGTSAQSEVLDRKSKGKGLGLWMKLSLRLMNHTGILPDNVQFEYSEVDLADEQQEALVKKTRAEGREIRLQSGELLPIEARQEAVAAGDLTMEQFEENADAFAAERKPASPDETLIGEEQPESPDDEAMVEGERAAGPVTLGKLISSRLHRSFTDAADDMHGLGYFEDTAQRVAASGVIGPVLAKLETDLKRAGLWEIELDPEDADRIVELSLKDIAEGIKEEERAGPSEDRLDFEDDVATVVERGMGRARTLLTQRMQTLATNGVS